MTQRELNGYWLALLNKRAQLVYEGCEYVAPGGDSTTNGTAQAGGQIRKRVMPVITFDRNARLLREVRSALDRIGAGTFGTCLECGSGLSGQQFSAVPWTRSCVLCQEAVNWQTELTSDDSLVHAA